MSEEQIPEEYVQIPSPSAMPEKEEDIDLELIVPKRIEIIYNIVWESNDVGNHSQQK